MRITIDKLFLSLIIFLNILFSFDYLMHGAKPANFDAVAHITSIAQFHRSLADGEFPVMWGDGFANYGLPLGTIAHQIPMYAGALLTFITNDVLLSFHIIYLIGAVLSAVFFYILLRNFISSESALIATVFYSLAPYRIINFYLRGAYPEFLSSVWVPLIFLALYKLRTHPWKWWVLFVLSSAGLTLTHPMLLIIYAPLFLLWFIFLTKKSWSDIALLVTGGLLAIGISAYYFLPLNLESKYLYHGMTKSHYAQNQTTDLASFFNPFWRFNCTYRNDIFGRCHLIKAGVFETIIVISSVILTLFIAFNAMQKNARTYFSTLMQKYFENNKLLWSLWMFALVGAVLSVLLSSQLLEPIYMKIRILGNIQYPWRFLSAYLFLPPILLGILSEYLKRVKIGQVFLILSIIFVVSTRFTQLYAKNYTVLPQSYFYFTHINLHSFIMNTIWSGETADYPIRRDKATIESGSGVIANRSIKNASRKYVIEANSDVLVSDNTFYFPGWKVYIDEKPASIEFQDPSYRGVITFKVPAGKHTVRVVYEDTKVRLAGKLITLVSFVGLVLAALFFWRRDKKHRTKQDVAQNSLT